MTTGHIFYAYSVVLPTYTKTLTGMTGNATTTLAVTLTCIQDYIKAFTQCVNYKWRTGYMESVDLTDMDMLALLEHEALTNVGLSEQMAWKKAYMDLAVAAHKLYTMEQNAYNAYEREQAVRPQPM